MNDLKGKNIIVTGASGGIGKSIIEKLNNAGANIVASGTKKEKLDELKNKYANIKTFKFDISQSERIEEFVEKKEYREKRKSENRGKAASKHEITNAIESFLNGVPISEISARMEPYFWDPVAVELDEEGRVYVLETGRHRFQIFERL